MAATLREAAAARGVLVGTACSPNGIADEPVYAETLGREFNALVAENCMKFSYLQPERGRFDFGLADEIVAFAQAHDQRLRGHTLVWHNQIADWAREAEFSRSEALDVLQAHIFTVLEHFKGAAYCWDVVNEALADEGGWREKSPWFRAIGPDYLPQVFRWAHEADPELQLFYNDYGMELPGAKSDACYALLRGLLDDGVPLHGVGFQYHLGVENTLDYDACTANLRRFHELGLDIHFTELDMGIKQPTTDALLQEQAAEYANRFRIGLDHGYVSAFMFWGFTDKHTWVPAFTKGEYDDPLLFDRAYKKKPAYDAVLAALVGLFTRGSDGASPSRLIPKDRAKSREGDALSEPKSRGANTFSIDAARMAASGAGDQ